MKHLLLLRHAKAETGSEETGDRSRRLTERGHRDAALMGRVLPADFAPDVALCSPAQRTRETLADFCAALARPPRSVFDDALYSAPSGDYLQTIRSAGDGADRLLVVGHNPTIHRTAVLLAGRGDARLRQRMAEKFPTAALAIFTLAEDDWGGAKEGSGTLVSVMFASQFRGGGADD